MTEKIQEFSEDKRRYTELRSAERNKIICALIEHGYPIMNMNYSKNLEDSYDKRAGRGLTNYTSGGTIAPFDLSNWMWINTMKNNYCLSICLQSIETDSKTGNTHALLDRIAFSCDHPENARKNEITGFDLPLSQESLSKLIEDFGKFIASLD